MRTIRRAPLVGVLLLLPVGARPETVDLHLYRYCSPGTFCAHPSLEAYDEFVCKAVEEMNVVWEPTGISFRPVIHPVDSTSPADATGLPPNKTKYYQTAGCKGDDPDNDAIRAHWREHVAQADTAALSLMLTKGRNTCCSGIPRTWKDLDKAHGFFCDAHPDRTLRGVGTLWAHEMGHHWSLAHTHGGCRDAADNQNPEADADAGVAFGCDLEHVSCETDADCELGGTCVPDALPPIADTPPDRCRFEPCQPVCQNDPDLGACETDADCDPGEGPCACPGADEDLTGNILDDHTWFASPGEERRVIPSASGISLGSPHGSWCPAHIKTRSAGVTLVSDTTPPTEVTIRDVMSYHGAFCRGPYVLSGDRREAFTADQLTRIAACRDQIFPRDAAHLPDVCAEAGGDTDHDGICDDDDNCAQVRNTCQSDSDDDGKGDACDCPGASPATGDLDGDGIPDPCDPDRDGDGCYNDPGEDDHPDQAQLLEQTTIYVGCGIASESRYITDVADTDGDGTINCRDADDDNDGICDAPGPGCAQVGDPCPEVPGVFCTLVGAGEPCPPAWFLCDIQCLEFFLKIVQVINPDPTAELVFDRISMVNRALFAAPLAGKTAAESVKAIADKAAGVALAASGAGTGTAAALDAQAVRLELWQRRDGVERRVATIGEYDASRVRLGELVHGGIVRVVPGQDAEGAPILEIETTYGIGMRSPEAVDRDRDGTPDLLDNCLTAANPKQEDADADGFGNACDADLDEDGTVDDEDVARVRSCSGADLSVEVPILEPASFDGEALGEPLRQPDPLAVALAAACRGADLDEDEDVDAGDVRLAETMLGRMPGPSAVARGFPIAPPSFAPLCAQGATIEKARVVLAKLDHPRGSQQVRLRGKLALPFPFSPPIDPVAKGLGLTLGDASGQTLLDVRIPGGDGWKKSPDGKVTRYHSRAGVAGLDAIEVRQGQGRQQQLVGIRVRGRGVNLGTSSPALPLLWQVNFDPEAVATRQCGETDFGFGPEQPTCTVKKEGALVECR